MQIKSNWFSKYVSSFFGHGFSYKLVLLIRKKCLVVKCLCSFKLVDNLLIYAVMHFISYNNINNNKKKRLNCQLVIVCIKLSQPHI